MIFSWDLQQLPVEHSFRLCSHYYEQEICFCDEYHDGSSISGNFFYQSSNGAHNFQLIFYNKLRDYYHFHFSHYFFFNDFDCKEIFSIIHNLTFIAQIVHLDNTHLFIPSNSHLKKLKSTPHAHKFKKLQHKSFSILYPCRDLFKSTNNYKQNSFLPFHHDQILH